MGFRVYETIQACGIFHTAQAARPLGQKVALEGEEGPQEAVIIMRKQEQW